MATERNTDLNNPNTDVGRADRVERDDRFDSDRPDANRDPITGAPGSHPIGTGVGAASGGAAGFVAGAAIGTAVPGPGTVAGGVIGAVVGAVGGGLAGKGVAESINPTEEEAYWRENYKTRPYYTSDYTYEEYAPAYRYGWESRTRYQDRRFEEVEPELERDWDKSKSSSRLGWDKAKHATRDAWHRVERAAPSDSDKNRR